MSDALPAPPELPPTNSNDRGDALAVLRRLREAGHVAYFAGGCVRDLLLGREPKDWDVATDAPPGRVRELFTHTQAVGAAFGVVLVRHRRSQVEVATFRSDGRYSDGRHPEGVTFTTAEEDAKRRDFTINGLFLDPLATNDADLGHADRGSVAGRVIDLVGGQADIAARVVRAIGNPNKRFEEDHLRVLRAVRFAARLSFAIEPATAAAIRAHAPLLTRISPERVAEELRTMLPPPTRAEAWRLLNGLELAPVIFRFVDVPPGEPDENRSADGIFSKLEPDRPVAFPLSLAAATVQWFFWAAPIRVDVRQCFEKSTAGRLVGALRRALRLSNEECDAIDGTLQGLLPLTADAPPGVAALKRFLARPTAGLSRKLMAATAAGGGLDAAKAAEVEGQLAKLEQTDYAPPPLITGDDLTAAGFKPGPKFKRMLDAAYDAQLEGRATTRAEAMAASERAAE
jgi:tRNA nucleotidyltransferase/poly(A) polymerase